MESLNETYPPISGFCSAHGGARASQLNRNYNALFEKGHGILISGNGFRSDATNGSRVYLRGIVRPRLHRGLDYLPATRASIIVLYRQKPFETAFFAFVAGVTVIGSLRLLRVTGVMNTLPIHSSARCEEGKSRRADR